MTLMSEGLLLNSNYFKMGREKRGGGGGGDFKLSSHSTSCNRPFPSSKKFHFQNEAKCKTFVVEMSFNYDANKTHFHNKGFALSLVLKVKLFGTRKWPIVCHVV